MGPMMSSFAACYKSTDGLIPLITNDLSNEQATWRSRDGKGPSISWSILHLLHYRYNIMAALGVKQADPFKELGSASATDGKNYPAIADLAKRWEELKPMFYQAIDRVTDDDLKKVLPAGPHGEKKLVDSIGFLTWHEAYHVGAIGQLRKEQGLLGPAEKVVAAMEAATKA